jgi:hypothetical protein
MAEMKGTQLRAILLFLVDRFGPAPVNAAIATLGPEERTLIPTAFLDASWYPFETLRAIRKIARALKPDHGTELAVEMGRAVADYTLAGVYRSLRVKDPQKLVDKAEKVHAFFYREAQEIEASALAPTSCLVRYRYARGVRPAPSTCASMSGFWTRALELSGARRVQAAHPKCTCEDGDACEFVFEWQ